MDNNNWFTEWFNTPYYHILYANRNDNDAQVFMKNLVRFLNIPKQASILDLPCGKGRHAIFLNSLGYTVTGADLSKNSIDFAKQFENDTLQFYQKDMREPFTKTYNYIFNLFTSFGYFKDDAVDVTILKNIKKGLKKDGVFVFDFLNATKVDANLVAKEVKTLQNITFNIQREIKNNFILKHISFTDNGKDYAFTEQVKFLDLKKMEKYFKAAGFKITAVFGNYNLEAFNANTSDRLIIIAK